MSSKYRRFAPFGLYLALAAALAAAGLYIVQREWNLALQISLGLVVVGLAVFTLLDPQRVRELFTGRQARYGSNALVMSIAFIGILVIVNFLVYKNPQRWDLTEDQQFTLTEETKATLDKLPQTVSAQAFFTSDYPSENAEELLDQYQFYSDGKFTYTFVDPVANPVAAEQAKITRNGTVVLSMGDQQQNVDAVTEKNLTSALVRLISPDEQGVYFLTGHGEISLETGSTPSLAQAQRLLESKNYKVSSLNLLASNQIPEDARLIIVAGPQNVLDSTEIERLQTFLDNGGALIVMEEPLPLTNYGEAESPLAAYLRDNWGIQLGADMVIDLSSSQASVVAVGSQYGSHPITGNLQGFVNILPTARSVSVLETSNGVSQVVLVSTSPQAWAETDLAALENENAEVQPNEGADLLGPVPLAVAAEHFESGGRVVVFGDAEFATNEYLTAYGNADLFINTVDWATEQEDLISLTPKETTQRFMLPPTRVQMNLILLGAVILLPGSVLVAGVVVFFQRRRRG